ncbi:DUF2516 family protein [Corynebacterium hindlerae]|uniref:DUF2516 family protein n=1 Tax=Corynebacterium hindlerae TaxID=699041 RepID=UPI003AAEDC0A
MPITPDFIYLWVNQLLYWLMAGVALYGAVLVATTREDAFSAADRQGKWVWCAILVGSAFAIATKMMFLSWIGLVAVGVFFFDVRPQLKDILSGRW